VNWLDPKQVEEWLADDGNGAAERRHCWYALEQFVRALAEERSSFDLNRLGIAAVARLLVAALDGEE